ncbi:MAG TPA: tetratricopeptide repeat protein [Rariglobus sp.]|nr:tetratricopeptide repeat protein [Rariglobus sp.]
MIRLVRIFCGLLFFTAAAQGADSPALTAAIVLFDAHRVPEAREQLAGIVAKEPENIRALWYLGRSDLKMQRREEAATTLAKAAELAPLDHRILADYGSASLLRATELGASFRALGFARRGRNALEQAVKLAPDIVGYREGLVQFYTRAPGFAGGDFDKAYAHIAEITKRDPARGTVIRANTLASEKRYDEALTVCEKFLLTAPDNYLALYTLGRIASETGRELARGETALRRCLELTPRIEEPDHAGAHYRLGMIAEKAARPADARREYQAALALEPEFLEVKAALARLKD